MHMEVRSLDPDELELCTLVAEASLSNHFSPEREVLDRRIARAAAGTPLEDVRERMQQRVRQFADRLVAEARSDPAAYSGEQRRLLELTLLFDVFHRAMAAMDAHIEEQIARGDSPAPVTFAGDVLRLLTRRGVSSEDAVAYFGVFYQLRRAYYFVERRLVGASPCMRKLRSELWCNVFTTDQEFYKRCLLDKMEDFSTMLLGETGTGKGSAAAAIGRSAFIPFLPAAGRFAESFTRAFVAINLSQYPPGLIESELFGHRKGAFTGAVSDHEGVFARCSAHGATFLDEIGEVSVPVQIKLLQVLQDRTFSPVGSHERRRFAGRVIAATNRDLDSLRRQGLFRDDFYYRLCSDVIVVPTLRQRIAEDPEELLRLVRTLVKAIVGIESDSVVARVAAAVERAPGMSYAWPGNVRELEQCVRRVLLRDRYAGETGPVARDALEALAQDVQSGQIDASSLLARYCASLYDCHGTYEAVSRIAQLDRRTARKYVESGRSRIERIGGSRQGGVDTGGGRN